MSQIDDVKDHVMRNRGEHTAHSVQDALGGAYSLVTIRAAFQQLKDEPSSGVESVLQAGDRIWSPGGGPR